MIAAGGRLSPLWGVAGKCTACCQALPLRRPGAIICGCKSRWAEPLVRVRLGPGARPWALATFVAVGGAASQSSPGAAGDRAGEQSVLPGDAADEK